MLSTLTDVANYALNAINAGSIASIDGTDRISGICKKYMDVAFESVLSEGEFSGCRKRKLLSSSSVDPIPEYSFSWELPSRFPSADGYIKTLRLESYLTFEVEDWILSTDDPAPTLLYVYRPTNLSRYQPIVLDAVAYRLAEISCLEITADMNKKMAVELESQAMMKRAKAHNAQEKNGVKRQNPRWNDFNDGVSTRGRFRGNTSGF